jgi:hypothetical protein
LIRFKREDRMEHIDSARVSTWPGRADKRFRQVVRATLSQARPAARFPMVDRRGVIVWH